MVKLMHIFNATLPGPGTSWARAIVYECFEWLVAALGLGLSRGFFLFIGYFFPLFSDAFWMVLPLILLSWFTYNCDWRFICWNGERYTHRLDVFEARFLLNFVILVTIILLELVICDKSPNSLRRVFENQYYRNVVLEDIFLWNLNIFHWCISLIQCLALLLQILLARDEY